MDIGSIIVTFLFIVLTSLCVIAVKVFFGVSFLTACVIGVPAALGIGMLMIWLLGRLSGPKSK